MFTHFMLQNEAGDANSGGSISEESIESIEGNQEEGGEELSAEPELTPAQQKKMLKQIKGKFNGKEFTEELPFEIPEEYAEYMAKQIQMAKLSQHKAQELSTFEQAVNSFLQELKSNPKKALQNPAVGIDVKQLAAEILQEEYEQSQKSPEQIEKEKLEMRLKELEEERENERQERDRQELERLTEMQFERLDQEFTRAFEEVNIPKTSYALAKMTEYMINVVENGYDISPKEAAQHIQANMMSDVQELLRALPADKVEELLGSEIMNSLRKSRVAASKKPPVPVKSGIKDVGRSGEKKAEAPVNPKTIKDFFGI